MLRKLGFLVVIMLALALLVVVAMASDPAGSQARSRTVASVASASYTYNTAITVTSGTDPDTSKSYTCYTLGVPKTPCTLRRAIVESRLVGASDRPVLIRFAIPQSPAEGYDSSLGVWKIQIAGSTNDDFRDLSAQTIIDGSTQPGGRTTGPKIIVDGQGKHNYGFITRYDGSEIRGLVMQNFKTAHIQISSNDNLVENCWFGLSDDGTTLSSGQDDETIEGGSGVAIAGNMSNNTIRNNVFAGFFGVAAAIRGDNNVFAGNWIGLRADGTVPIPAQFSKHPCLSGAWTGGVGITVEGDDHQIGGPTAAEGNVFAGLFLDVGPSTTQRPAMDVTGSGHTIQNNVIGLDVNGDLVGVCGRGLDLGGGPSDMQVLDNTLAETGLSAILMNNWQCNGNTLQTNIIKRADAWPGEQGNNPFPEDAIAYGPHVPAALRSFKPAEISQVDGKNVQGTSGQGSSCPACTIEVFLDDTDAVTETLQSLAVVTADGSGQWSATLPAPLEPGQGLRTMSTVPDNFTITGLDAGTTSNLSLLQAARHQIFLPLVVRQR